MRKFTADQVVESAVNNGVNIIATFKGGVRWCDMYQTALNRNEDYANYKGRRFDDLNDLWVLYTLEGNNGSFISHGLLP